MKLICEAMGNGARKRRSCEIIGIPIRTLERWENDKLGDKRLFVKNIPSNKLNQNERDEIIDICCSERFKDLSPNEIVPILAEEGRYIASESTYYRILRQEDLLAHRSESKPSQKRNKPDELKATGADQVLSWDITYLLSNIKGKYFYLYLFEDVWSRAIRGWDIYEDESSDNAAELMRKIVRETNIGNVILHSDNGSPMKGATMLATLQKLGVVPSFSRPRVSNDNPYSESLFKTLKYTAGYPRSFNSIEEAREWVEGFVNWYNTEHRHSGIKFVTPMQRHNGEDKKLLITRRETYKKAQQRNPERWSRNIRNWDWIEEVYLNPNSLQDSRLKVA
jgi:transposase InsO family protein